MKNDRLKSKKSQAHSIFIFSLSFFILIFAFCIPVMPTVFAQPARTLTTPTPDTPELNPNNSSFKIVVCDGPAGANTAKDPKYVPCDFNGLMLQIRHIINIMMVLGVFASIAAFSWAGALYISGNPEKKKQAHAIFPKIFTGFIIMLSAWFIVYQILSWLTKNDGFKTLLGSPQ